jgi:hypothetical protein
MPSNFGPIFFVLLGVSCLLFLVSLFILMPMPYLFSAIVLKVETRGYWKAFGAAILSAMAGSAASSTIYFLLGRVLGIFTQMREGIITISGVQYPVSLPVPGSGLDRRHAGPGSKHRGQYVDRSCHLPGEIWERRRDLVGGASFQPLDRLDHCCHHFHYWLGIRGEFLHAVFKY